MIGLYIQTNALVKVTVFSILLFCNEAFAQKYAQRLLIKSGEIFQLKGNSFEIDSLVLEDGAELLLDRNFKATEIIVTYLELGLDCLITGSGINGEHADLIPLDHTVNHFGTVRTYKSNRYNGMPGTSASDLTLFAKNIALKGRFAVNLRGGDGGNANRKAGVGGDGGNFIFGFPKSSREKILANAIVFTQGGHGGEILIGKKNMTSNFAADGQMGLIEYINIAN